MYVDVTCVPGSSFKYVIEMTGHIGEKVKQESIFEYNASFCSEGRHG